MNEAPTFGRATSASKDPTYSRLPACGSQFYPQPDSRSPPAVPNIHTHTPSVPPPSTKMANDATAPPLHHFHPAFHHPIIHAVQHTISPLTGSLLIFAVHKAWQIPAAVATIRAASVLRAAGKLSFPSALRVCTPTAAAVLGGVGLGSVFYRTATEPHDPVTGAPLSPSPPSPLLDLLPGPLVPLVAPPTSSPDLSARLLALYPQNEVPAVARSLSAWPSSALVTSLLRHIHDGYGVPWWGAIAGFTVLVRVAVAPANLHLLRNSLRMKQILPDLKRLGDALALPGPRTDPRRVAAASELVALLAARGASPWQGVLLFPFLLPPTILSVFGAVHNLALSEPKMATEGALWFPDLVARDKTQFLPIISAVTWLWQVEMGSGVHYAAWPSLRLATRVTALAMVPLTATLPSGVFVFWVTSNLFAVVRGYAARSDVVRRALRIPFQKDIALLTHLPRYKGL